MVMVVHYLVGMVYRTCYTSNPVDHIDGMVLWTQILNESRNRYLFDNYAYMMEYIIWSNKYIEKKWDVGLLNVKFFQNWNQDQNCMSSSENQAHSVHISVRMCSLSHGSWMKERLLWMTMIV